MTVFKGTKWDKNPVTLSNPTGWDAGATGKANRYRLRAEPATDFDPETGRETPNPNGVKRHRRETWVARYLRQGKLTQAQASKAENLYNARAGNPAKDPLAAIVSKVDGKGSGDPQVTAIDRKREYFTMWAKVPAGCKPFLTHVVLNDLSIRSMPHGNSGDTAARYMKRLQEGLDAIC
jgi:hypothetical protein